MTFKPPKLESFLSAKEIQSYDANLSISTTLNLLCEVLNRCNDNIPEIIKKLKIIKMDVTSQKNCHENLHIIRILSELYLMCNPKHPCKLHFASVLLDPIWNQDALWNCLNDGFSFLMNGSDFLFVSESELVQSLDHFCQTFSTDITIFMFYKGLLFISNMLSIHRQTIIDLSESTLKASERGIRNLCDDLRCGAVLILQRNTFMRNRSSKSDPYPIGSDLLQTLLSESIAVLQLENIGWECWNAAGTLLSLLYFSYYPKQQCLTMLKKILDQDQFECGRFPYASYIGLCCGCLVCLNSHVQNDIDTASSKASLTDLSNESTFEDGNSLVLSCHEVLSILKTIFCNLCLISSRVQTVPEQVAIAKCFVQWTVTAKNLVKDFREVDWNLQEFLTWLHSYATISLDHQTDVIRHQAKDIIVNVLSIGSFLNSEAQAFARQLVADASTWDWHKRSVYIFLQCATEFVAVDYFLSQDDRLQEKLLTACLSQSLAPYSSQLYFQLARMHNQNGFKSDPGGYDPLFPLDVWLKPVFNRLLNCNANQSRLLLDYCAVKLFKLYGRSSVLFLVSYFSNNDAKSSDYLNIFIMCLRQAQRLGLLQKETLFNVDGDNRNIDQNVIKAALVHQSNQIRLDTFCLVCECSRTTVLVEEHDLELIKFSLPYSMNCHCPAFRQQLLNTIKKFLHRLSSNTDSLQKREKNEKNQLLISSYLEFKFWLLHFCLENLHPGACYPRKFISLHILNLIVSSFLTSHDDVERSLKLFTTKRTIELIGLLKDNYDDIRQSTLDLLTHPLLKDRVKKTVKTSFLWNLVESSLAAGRKSCKPEVCRDAAFNLRFSARINQSKDNNVITLCQYFVSSLRDDVKVASKNLLKAVETGPMHGCLLCLRMLLADANISANIPAYRNLILDCVSLCFKVAFAVLPVVGGDSPEGYVPKTTSDFKLPEIFKKRYAELSKVLKEHLKTNNEPHQVSGQRMLVMCWRSAKESYLLLQLIASLASRSLDDPESSLLSIEKFLEIGEHLRSQLMETVHRGTFEVAYSVFREYVPLLWRSANKRLNSQPRTWIYSTIADIRDAEKAKSLCATRRSAGLPFFLQALLGSDKSQVSRDCLSHVMNSLLPLVSCDVIEGVGKSVECDQQVHTLNVIRGLMKDASLGEEMLPYLSKCVMAAITGFRSCRWSIRNSSTLLYSALVTRIFGVKKEKDLENSRKNRMSSREFFSKMPELEQFTIDLLERQVDQHSDVNDIDRQSNLFPVLLLLSRVYPSPVSESVDPLTAYPPLLIRCGYSPILKCRVMAANALASVTSSADVPRLLQKLAASLGNDLPANRVHGTLIQLEKIVRMRFVRGSKLNSEQLVDLEALLAILSKKEICARDTRCLVLRSTFIDLCLEIACLYLENICEEGSRAKVLIFLKELVTKTSKYVGSRPLHVPGHSMLLESAGKLFAWCWLWNIDPDSLTHVIRSRDVTVTLSCLRTLKKFLKNNKVSPAQNADLESALIQLLDSSTDRECKSKILLLLSPRISISSSKKVLILTQRLMVESSLRDDQLVGAIVTCQGACFGQVFNQSADVRISSDVLDWLRNWVAHLLDTRVPPRHNTSVRQSAANVLHILALDLLIDHRKRLGAVLIDAWKILFVLLVDEDDGVREVACQIVQKISDHCHMTDTAQPYVDLLSLDLAMDCLISLEDRQSLDEISSFLLDFAEQGQAEYEPQDGASEQLFDGGANNAFIETPVLRHLVEKARVRISTASVN